jgi:hypothetical protein
MFGQERLERNKLKLKPKPSYSAKIWIYPQKTRIFLEFSLRISGFNLGNSDLSLKLGFLADFSRIHL